MTGKCESLTSTLNVKMYKTRVLTCTWILWKV